MFRKSALLITVITFKAVFFSDRLYILFESQFLTVQTVDVIFHDGVIFTFSLLRYFVGKDLVRFGGIYHSISTGFLFELVIIGFCQGFLLVFSH